MSQVSAIIRPGVNWVQADLLAKGHCGRLGALQPTPGLAGWA